MMKIRFRASLVIEYLNNIKKNPNSSTSVYTQLCTWGWPLVLEGVILRVSKPLQTIRQVVHFKVLYLAQKMSKLLEMCTTFKFRVHSNGV